MTLTPIQRDTILSRGIPQAIGAIENSRLIENATHVRSLGRALEGVPCVIAAAGNSLGLVLDTLAEYPGRGLLIATNTSLGALAARGITADLVSVMEAIDVTSHLADHAKYAKRLLLDLGVSPEIMQRAHRPLVYHGPAIESRLYTYALGYGAMMHSGASLTGAIACAVSLGCSPIYLVGADFGFAGGRTYADGTPWAGLTYEVRDGKLEFEGAPERDVAHEAAGVAKVPRSRPIVELPGALGGTVHSVGEFVDQLQWLERLLARCPWLDIRRVPGPSSAKVEGITDEWATSFREDAWLEDTYHVDVEKMHRPIGPERLAKLAALVRSSAEVQRNRARAVLAGESPPLLASTTACVEALSLPAFLIIGEQTDQPVEDRRRARWEHRLQCADVVLGCLEQATP